MDPAARFDRITVEPDKCGGKPCIRGMRITVRRVLEILATYPDRAELFREYPFLEEEDLRQALSFAAAAVRPAVYRQPTSDSPPGKFGLLRRLADAARGRRDDDAPAPANAAPDRVERVDLPAFFGRGKPS